ncbi:MAG: RloB family protein [Pseudonocardiaceae bacterium]
MAHRSIYAVFYVVTEGEGTEYDYFDRLDKGLFDHDERNNIDQVCATAERRKVKVGLFHPSFELWLLLHFQDFTPAAQHGKSELIIDKLRNSHQAFANYGRPNKRIDQPRFAALMEGDGIRNAVHRARRLSRHFTRETPSQRDPSTEV